MKRELWAKAVQSSVLAISYFWYKANIHLVVVRVLF
jgi:hypothetical protein